MYLESRDSTSPNSDEMEDTESEVSESDRSLSLTTPDLPNLAAAPSSQPVSLVAALPSDTTGTNLATSL